MMNALKNFCCLRRYDEFRNFSKHHVDFSCEVHVAFDFSVYSLC